MKQISQNYKTGLICLEEVQPPVCKTGGVLVQTQFSVISAGTEAMKAREGKMSYLGKAKARPDQVKKVIQSVKQQGLISTYEKVMNKLDSLTPLGYSLSGIVTQVQKGAEEFQVGQRVACAGVGYANHAEVNFVPKNLVVAIPDNVAMEHAAFTTIGSIAMQGFRQAQMQLGETACVIGLGLLGQLLVQILKAGGIRVIGIDLMESRCELAEQLGAEAAFTPENATLHSTIDRITAGIGIDCTFIAAGGKSNVPVELAVEIARDRGRIVDIGKTKLDLPWNAYYEKELDVRFSRSYGPGRYDQNYEERGIDYPVGYVRWTERRNMESFLDLLATGKIDITPLITQINPFAEAESVYQKLVNEQTPTIGLVFEHTIPDDTISKPVDLSDYKPTSNNTILGGKVRLGVIGAGNYASSMLLPHLTSRKSVELTEVATGTSLSSKNAAHKFGFKRASTDYKKLISAGDINSVLIATRHASHAEMTSEALLKGKNVYVEKPLAISMEGLKLVADAVRESGNNRLMVGFNRRFAPMIQIARDLVNERSIPLTMHYRVHAGQLDSGSWYLDSESNGSRFVGEAGHFFDVLSYFAGTRPMSVVAKALRPNPLTDDDLENMLVTVEFEGGSIANLMYVTQGGQKVPKEYLEIFGGGRTVQLHNFEKLLVFEGDDQRTIKTGKMDKGQKGEMNALVEAINDAKEMPISLQSLFDTTLTTLASIESLRTGQPVNLAEFGKSLSGADALILNTEQRKKQTKKSDLE